MENTSDEKVRAARRGLLKAVWEASGLSDSIATRFSSKPLNMDGYFSGAVAQGSFMSDTNSDAASKHFDLNDMHKSIFSASSLTSNEKQFLQELLETEDHKSIQFASKRLSNKILFPPTEEEEENEYDHKNPMLGRESSKLQQQLFRLHERASVSPSVVLKRINTGEGIDENSITRDEGSWDLSSDRIAFSDINSWIDGNQGVEISDDGNPEIPIPTSSPFKILGTSADDVSCHPHILSPSLMEVSWSVVACYTRFMPLSQTRLLMLQSLLAFVPESLQNGYHFWLKYSLARDGKSLLNMLRHCRASFHTILAVETDDGFVFGSFTSEPWRLLASGFSGSKDSFVWRMRQSRSEPCKSVVEQVLRESKIDVFPYTSKNNNIQFCCMDFLALGEGELENMHVQAGSHFGNAIRLNKSLRKGSTSTSCTFDNPSLIHTEKRGEEFNVANIELWSLTPHTSLESAIRSEMRSLFLEEEQKTKYLNLLEILVSQTA
eukprot:scaffold21500_cov119-Cylindrotheca_fusiformis.AAC.3